MPIMRHHVRLRAAYRALCHLPVMETANKLVDESGISPEFPGDFPDNLNR